jgi:hypothetical protein
MDKKILNEINRQRQIMGLPTILLKEDTGISSIGEYFANFVKKIAKQSELTDAAGKALMKIGRKTFNQEEFAKLISDLKAGKYNEISDEILDELTLLIKTLKDEEGVSYFQKTMDEFTTQMQKNDPNFNFDEWAKVAEDRVNRNLETLDDSITRITGDNPLLKRIFEEDLIARYNKQVDLSAAENARRAEELAQTQQNELARQAAREQGDIINRMRNRFPGPAASFTDLQWYRYFITWKYSPLTKSQQWYNIPRLLESAILQFKNSDSELNIVLDEWEGICKTFFERINSATDIKDIKDELGQEMTSIITRIDALTPHDKNFDTVVNELTEIYSRNPELSKLPDKDRQLYIESFKEMVERCNPEHPDFPSFFPAIWDLFRSSGMEWVNKFNDDVLERMGESAKKTTPGNWISRTVKPIWKTFKIALDAAEAHLFTGTLKGIKGWKEWMGNRPYLLPIFKNTGFPLQKTSKYILWWSFVKLVISPLWGIAIGTFETLKGFFSDDFEVYGEEVGRWEAILKRLGPNIIIELKDAFGEVTVSNVPDPNDSTKIIQEINLEFSLLESLWPVSYQFGVLLEKIGDFFRGTLQKEIRESVQDASDEAVQEIQQADSTVTQTVQRGLERAGISTDSMQIETPEIDSTLLRQQEGPVEGSDDPTSPNYSYGMLINAWNNANTNDKISEYDQTNKKAIYKGKEGTISLNGNNEMIFISDDNSVRKRFDGYKAQ